MTKEEYKARLNYALELYRSGLAMDPSAQKAEISYKALYDAVTDDDRYYHDINRTPNTTRTTMSQEWANEWDLTRLALLTSHGKRRKNED